MEVNWVHPSKQEIEVAVASLKESGEDHIRLPEEKFIVLRADGELYRNIESETSGLFLPIEGEAEFFVTF